MESRLIIAASTESITKVVTDYIDLKNYIDNNYVIDKNENVFKLNQIAIFDTEKAEVVFNNTVTNRIKEGNKTEGNKYYKQLYSIKFKPDVHLVRALKLDKEKIQLIKAPQGRYWNDSRYDLYIPISLFSNPEITSVTTNAITYDNIQYFFKSDEFSLDSYVHTIEGTETIERHKEYWNAKLEILKEEINNIDTIENLENYIERYKLKHLYVNNDKIKKYLQIGGTK